MGQHTVSDSSFIINMFSVSGQDHRLITEHDTEVMPTLRIANKDSFINVMEMGDNKAARDKTVF